MQRDSHLHMTTSVLRASGNSEALVCAYVHQREIVPMKQKRGIEYKHCPDSATHSKPRFVQLQARH